jgi:hypothetical protein
MKLFGVELKHKTLFRNLYTSISDKVQQESIEKVGVVCTKTNSYCMSTLYLMANISQWNNALYNNCIRIMHNG